MKPEKMKRINQFRTLRQLAQSVEALEQPRRIIQSVLPLSLQAHVIGASLTPDAVILLTDGAAWVTRLRFQAPAIQQALRAHFPHRHIGPVRIKIQPQETSSEPAFQPPPAVSPTIRQQALTLARDISEPSLQQKLSCLLEQLPTRSLSAEEPV